ncbi:hypothetical protein V8F06_014854, partial [Rhypophila decipiens]
MPRSIPVKALSPQRPSSTHRLELGMTEVGESNGEVGIAKPGGEAFELASANGTNNSRPKPMAFRRLSTSTYISLHFELTLARPSLDIASQSLESSPNMGYQQKSGGIPPLPSRINANANSRDLHGTNDDSSGLARLSPDVLPNKIPFTFSDHHRHRNDLQTAAATEAGRCRPFYTYLVHIHGFLRNTSRAFAMEVHFWAPGSRRDRR